MSEGRFEEFAATIDGYEVNAQTTVNQYQRWAKRFDAWRPGDEPDESMLRDWDSFLADEDMVDYPWENSRGPNPPDEYAYQSRIKALSAAKLWLKHTEDTRVDEKVQNLCKGEPAPFEPTVLDASEVDHVINQAALCDNSGCQAAVPLGYDAILRGAELADARVEDFDSQNGELHVRAVKGSEPTTVDLSSRAANAVRSHVQTIPDREYLFLNAYDNPWSADAWNAHFRRKHHEAGFHAFARHSAITNRLRQGEEFGSVYLRARHSNPQTTLRYVSIVGGSAPDWVDGR